MWSAASTTSALLTSYGSIGVVLSVGIAGILTAWAGLMGLAFGMRKIGPWVTYDEHGYRMEGGSYASAKHRLEMGQSGKF